MKFTICPLVPSSPAPRTGDRCPPRISGPSARRSGRSTETTCRTAGLVAAEAARDSLTSGSCGARRGRPRGRRSFLPLELLRVSGGSLAPRSPLSGARIPSGRFLRPLDRLQARGPKRGPFSVKTDTQRASRRLNAGARRGGPIARRHFRGLLDHRAGPFRNDGVLLGSEQ